MSLFSKNHIIDIPVPRKFKSSFGSSINKIIRNAPAADISKSDVAQPSLGNTEHKMKSKPEHFVVFTRAKSILRRTKSVVRRTRSLVRKKFIPAPSTDNHQSNSAVKVVEESSTSFSACKNLDKSYSSHSTTFFNILSGFGNSIFKSGKLNTNSQSQSWSESGFIDQNSGAKIIYRLPSISNSQTESAVSRLAIDVETLIFENLHPAVTRAFRFEVSELHCKDIATKTGFRIRRHMKSFEIKKNADKHKITLHQLDLKGEALAGNHAEKCDGYHLQNSINDRRLSVRSIHNSRRPSISGENSGGSIEKVALSIKQRNTNTAIKLIPQQNQREGSMAGVINESSNFNLIQNQQYVTDPISVHKRVRGFSIGGDDSGIPEIQ